MSQIPSRDFLVRQAVLNAVPKCWPATAELSGVAGALRKMRCDDGATQIEAMVLPFIRVEYRALASHYGVQVAK